MAETPRQIAERRRTVVDAGAALRGVAPETRVEWLSNAALELEKLGQTASADLAKSTGLSEPMVQWALKTTLQTVEPGTLQRVQADAAAAGGAPLSFLPLILAGNLFTASVRGVFVPLLLGIPVFAKASTREALFPRLLRDSLRKVDPNLASAFDVASFRGGDPEHEIALAGEVDSIAVYGSDETVADVRGRHSSARIIAHGHGLSLAYCSRNSFDADDTIRALALDVGAYDQRGCLSPQAVYVEGDRSEALTFAKRLADDGLAGLSASLPRGPIPLDVGAAQAQWRGLAEIEGDLFVGDEFAVAVVGRDALRWSPGYRNVSVVPIENESAAFEAWAPLGSTLKCVGIDPASLGIFSQAIARSMSLSATACALGTMQTPPFDAPADGHAPWHGLLR